GEADDAKDLLDQAAARAQDGGGRQQGQHGPVEPVHLGSPTSVNSTPSAQGPLSLSLSNRSPPVFSRPRCPEGRGGGRHSPHTRYRGKPPQGAAMRFSLTVALACAAVMPIFAGDGKIAPPAVERFRLDNGLRVRLRPVEGARLTALVLLYDVGADHDPAGR